MKQLLIIGLFICVMMSCTHKNHVYVASTSSATSETAHPRVSVRPTGSSPVGLIPPATAFRMSGDYANNVAVTISDGQLLYFPAPTDITADSEPVYLGDGWWLNNQGLGPHSVFTKYTFAEYAALPEAPDPNQLKMAVIPGAKVTDFIELPMNIDSASQNIEALKEYVKSAK